MTFATFAAAAAASSPFPMDLEGAKSVGHLGQSCGDDFDGDALEGRRCCCSFLEGDGSLPERGHSVAGRCSRGTSQSTRASETW